MPVGTGAISLTDVTTEIAGTQTSLQDCVDDHLPAGLDNTYWTSKPSAPVSLAEFRGYDDTPSLTSFSLNTTAETSPANACANSGSTTKYHDGSGASPVTSDTIYDNIGGTTPFNGGSQWFKNVTGDTGLLISAAGLVLVSTPC